MAAGCAANAGMGVEGFPRSSSITNRLHSVARPNPMHAEKTFSNPVLAQAHLFDKASDSNWYLSV